MSISGNTKKVAQAIFNAISEEKEIRELKELSSLDGYDFVFLGFPIHDFGPPKIVSTFIAQHAAGKTIAMFVTHGAPEDMEDVQQWLETCKKAADKSNIVGVFHCQGELSDEILSMIKKSNQPKLRSFAKFAQLAKGLPNEESLDRVKEFARNMVRNLAQK